MRIICVAALFFATFSTFSFDKKTQRRSSRTQQFERAGILIVGDTSKTMRKLDRFNNFMERFVRLYPIPYASYSKETHFLFGLTKFNAFRMRGSDKKDTITQASSINALMYYTTNIQHKLVLGTNLMLRKNKAIWKTDLINTYYPLLFYGTGNETKLANQRILDSGDIQFSMQYLFRVWRKWYVGPAVDFHYFYQVKIDESSIKLPEDNQDFSNNLGRQSGLGIRFNLEGRDNRLNAKNGFYVDAGYQIFDRTFASEFNYHLFNADVRYYFPLLKNVTLATQLKTESRIGEVPVQSLSLFGGDYFMRGNYLGRYRDKVLIGSQIEARFPLFWILGGTLFTGVGQVASDYSKINVGSLHNNYGFGLRIKVDPVHDINLRLDMAFTSEQSIFILNFAEAF
ncbi:MAG: BamA/TamA family outer membrane protein [Cytophagales bacterium]|jgi:hypothetical protein|nr:BamA/TamA family outer membrane protein [Cytophagales bacterium]